MPDIFFTKDNDDAQKPRKNTFEFFHSVENKRKSFSSSRYHFAKLKRIRFCRLSKGFFSFSKSLVTFIWLLSNFVHGPFEKQMHKRLEIRSNKSGLSIRIFSKTKAFKNTFLDDLLEIGSLKPDIFHFSNDDISPPNSLKNLQRRRNPRNRSCPSSLDIPEKF